MGRKELDVKIIFLHGDLHEKLHMEQPTKFIAHVLDEIICQLFKSVYGLK